MVIAAAALAGSASVASAQVWDSRGWVSLGERTVNGRFDHDRIEVGRMEGKFSKLTVVVENSDLEMIDFKIEFTDGTNYHPAVQQVFREGTRTRVIELPPGEHNIRYLDFKYKNTRGGGDAKVAVWAWKIGDNAPPPPPPASSWDSRGWTMLGERTVNGRGREDRDRIEVGRYEGRFSKMTVVVQDADLELLDMEVKFGRGPSWRPSNAGFYFREGTRTRVIDFPGDERSIRYIDFRYRNVPGGGHAKVQVWAKADASPPPPPPQQSNWRFESHGWEMLGEREVNGHGREDIDRIEVGRAMGKFRKLTVVVLDSELEMIDFSIKFKHGEPFHPAVNYFFREGTRTKVIDLPGDERTIQWVEFKYRNLPGERHAKVQVWAQ
ncbi:MAG TPA: hypothetical protein VGC41_10525 [Kofleriaceae bacterium]